MKEEYFRKDNRYDRYRKEDDSRMLKKRSSPAGGFDMEKGI